MGFGRARKFGVKIKQRIEVAHGTQIASGGREGRNAEQLRRIDSP